MKVVISAGGKGTRISSIKSDIPKPMIQIDGKPVLEHQINCLKEQGFLDIILVIGHLGSVIEDYFGDGTEWGVHISYYREVEPLGTAGALYYLKDVLTEDFLLINGDIIFSIDFNRFLQFHKEKKALASLFTHPNSHPYDSSIICADEENCITSWMNKEDARTVYKNNVNAGVHILSTEILDMLTNGGKVDLDREILKPLVATKRLYSYRSPEYVKDMGTPERYYLVCNDFVCGKVASKNLKNKQRAVFLDRDGTINVYKGFIRNQNDIELIAGVANAIKTINESGYLAIIVSNQPVIARGECTLEQLQEIHNKLETELGKEGAYVDDIFFCPHHPDKGFEGERVEYKIECECRKPKPGLLLEAAKRYNIDLEKSLMIGDDIRDYNAGINAGCRSFYVGGKPLEEVPSTNQYSDLEECITNLVNKGELSW
ncbi:HAD-IIIA family hydrolase [Anaerosporobacter faecicola]|uniref:HAD-IIIA family hydrolase n=1 Tax=Anaerosporobacter faecicola TaxID=2718714 RepID=UPI00143C3CA1|nr:HAD-IIIA family hydrolase [Anaerosporobacter faecicola]